MVKADEKPDAAIRERNSRDRAQRQRIGWLGMTAASYAVDTLFLALFALADTISGTVALAYGAAAAAICGGNYAVTASGWNLKLREPSLVKLTMILAVAMQLGVVLAAPQVAFPFLANLFTVFSFGMIWLSLRDSVMIWTLGIAGTAAVFSAVQVRIGVPVSGAFELTLVWLYFSLILGRCLLLSVNAKLDAGTIGGQPAQACRVARAGAATRERGRAHGHPQPPLADGGIGARAQPR